MIYQGKKEKKDKAVSTVLKNPPNNEDVVKHNINNNLSTSNTDSNMIKTNGNISDNNKIKNKKNSVIDDIFNDLSKSNKDNNMIKTKRNISENNNIKKKRILL
jgi:hypothetical protein